MLPEKCYLITRFLTEIDFHPGKPGIMDNGIQVKREINKQTDGLIQGLEAEVFFLVEKVSVFPLCRIRIDVKVPQRIQCLQV